MSHLLCRARRKSDDALVTGFYIERDLPFGVHRGEPLVAAYIIQPPQEADAWQREYEVYRDSVCLCSGVSDKNGALIFERDRCRITRPTYTDAIGEIRYSQGCFFFVEDETKNCVRLCDLKLNDMNVEILQEKEV